MNHKPFYIIDSYCKDNGKSISIRNLAYAIYKQQLLELIEEKSQEKNEQPTQEQIETMKGTLLSRNSIAAHVNLAEDLLKNEITTELKPKLRKYGFVNYCISVSTSVVASIIYSILVVILFIVGKEQIATWLTSLTK